MSSVKAKVKLKELKWGVVDEIVPLGGDGGLGLTGVIVRQRLHFGSGPIDTQLPSKVE